MADQTGFPTESSKVCAKPRGYRSLLVALDASDHADSSVAAAVALGTLWKSHVTGLHVYAARLHDKRFRQMEGGLPARYRDEQVLEQQRTVHDSLITRGLVTISDAYLDSAQRRCEDAGLAFSRRALEGKNYRELVREANEGAYDLLVLGALGLGAVASSRLGSVCERVVRRAAIDTLVIKNNGRDLSGGPIMVAVDGSTRAWGGLLTALAMARAWEVPLQVVAAFDPYFHYVAFNRIAGALSEEAGKVFRFEEQEKLHEEVIDSGLARIYEGHLEVARSLAAGQTIEIETKLLDGKPYDVIARQVAATRPALLVLGKLGIHADTELDIGGTTENLLRLVDCPVLLSQREHRPPADLMASITTTWTADAEQSMEKVPAFAREMARLAVMRYAHQRGHTVITQRLVLEATTDLCPAGHGERRASPAPPLPWTEAARERLASVPEPDARINLEKRAEKRARRQGCTAVAADHVAAFVQPAPHDEPPAGGLQ